MRSGIRTKFLLLITVLSAALIAVSVLISSSLYASSLRQNMASLCSGSSEQMASAISEDHTDFLIGFTSKVRDVYEENREELESKTDPDSFSSFEEREEYYSRFMQGIFPPKSGVGMSYEMAVFLNEYRRLLDEMDLLSFTDGLKTASVFLYDSEHGNLVYLVDRMPDNSTLYHFPASVAKPWNSTMSEALENAASAAFTEGSDFYSVSPIYDESGATGVFVLIGMAGQGISSNVRLFSLYTLGIMLGATLIIGLFILLFANRLIVNNIKKLSDASARFTSEIGDGRPEKVSAAIRSSDEIGELSETIDLMQDAIIGYTKSLAEKTSKEERIKAELELAARIQSESLPKGGLKSGNVTLESFLKPAREVGGDLYDYFMLDEKRLFFCLADVSGKGVPASLFMMRAKELFKAGTAAAPDLSSFAFRLNNELCKGNEENIFITAFFGILDTESGRLSYLRAGHEQPFLLRGGNASQFGEESNFPLGIFEDAEFAADEVRLQSGDTLLVFTDGLNEGINEAAEEFGYERIAETLQNAGGNVTGTLYDALCRFCGNEEQFDDVTMLSVSFLKTKRIELKDPGYEDIPAVTDAVLNELSGYEKDRISEVGLIIDEVMNNQISYAFPDTKKPSLGVRLDLIGDEAVLTFEDNGMPFDPLSDVSEEQLEDSPGGYGLLLVRSLSSSLRYEHSDGCNRLTVRKDMRNAVPVPSEPE